MANKVEIYVTTPVGRMVGGSLYKGKTVNSKGEPLIFKSGPNKGQPRTEYSIGVAFAKTPGNAHWANEIGMTKVNNVLGNHAWLRPVYDLGLAAFPAGEATRAAFSWKITDGDSAEPNKNMKKPCDNEGYPGHWIIWFTSASTAPKVLSADGSQVITEPGAVKPGYYVQVLSRVTDNVGSETPGIYWSLDKVALAAYGPEISYQLSDSEAGFGGTALPPGATAAPVGVASMPAPIPGPAASLPVAALPGLAPVPVPTPPVPVPVPVAAAAPARVMTPAAIAAGYTYETFKVGHPGSPWTDDMLVAQGHMVASAPVIAPLMPVVGSAPTPSAPAPIAVVPNPAILQAPAAVPVPVTPQYRLGPAAPAGQTVESLLAQVGAAGSGWTLPLLIQHMYLAQ